MKSHNRNQSRLVHAVLVLLMLAAGAVIIPRTVLGSDAHDSKGTNKDLAEEIHHQLALLPYFSVFDDLKYSIEGDGTVVISGQVVRPTLKSDAENVVRGLAGVRKVVDNVEVLPLSMFDDKIRLSEYRAIFSNYQLDRYALQAVPPIHIIVKDGRVTLTGVVATEADKDVAGIVANEVPGVFKVTNDLDVEKKVKTP